MLAICTTATMPMANICYEYDSHKEEEIMIDTRLTVSTREERSYVLEINAKRFIELLQDAGFSVPEGATVRVGEDGPYIDFDNLLQVQWTDVENQHNDYDSEPEIKGVIG